MAVVTITTDTEDSEIPQRTEVGSSTPLVDEIMQHADVKLSKVSLSAEYVNLIRIQYET